MRTKEDISNLRSQWTPILWTLGSICLPLSLSYMIKNFYRFYKEMKYKNQLQSKVVLITGASSGLGEALAHVFYEKGCKVILAARRKEELERVRKELLETHTTVPTYPPVVMLLDLSDLESLPTVIENITKTVGYIDILVNNGGISIRSDVLSSSVNIDMKVMLVNYFGSVSLTKAVLPSMIKRGTGRIVFISSVQGKFALPYRSAYSASKHALQAFSDSLRAEVAKHGIRVTCISPGYIKTSLSLNALTSSGERHGELDETTANGTTPDRMAMNILKSILRDDKDVIISQFSGHVAYWLRFMFPSVYFWVMEKRAKNGI